MLIKDTKDLLTACANANPLLALKKLLWEVTPYFKVQLLLLTTPNASNY